MCINYLAFNVYSIIRRQDAIDIITNIAVNGLGLSEVRVLKFVRLQPMLINKDNNKS